jgi:AcrR family transcriptional regulator
MSTSQVPQGQVPKRERGRIRVAAIMAAGAELFSDKGYDATTMTEIASRSGTATASLYRFFPTKELLAEALLRQFAEHAMSGLAELAAGAGTMTPGQLASAFIAYACALQRERRFATNLADARGPSDDLRQQFRQAMRKGIQTILRRAIPSLPAQASYTMACVVMSVLKGVGGIREESTNTRRLLILETEKMLGLYLAAAMAEANPT